MNHELGNEEAAMIRHAFTTLLAGGLFVFAPAAWAQQGHQHGAGQGHAEAGCQGMMQMSGGMMGMSGHEGMQRHGMMMQAVGPESGSMHATRPMNAGGAGPARILSQCDALALSAEQVARLEAIDKQLADAMEAHRQAAHDLHRQAAAALEGDAPDLNRYEARLRDLSEQMIRMHVASARAAIRAREVLTAEQRSRLAPATGGMPCEGMSEHH
jgi:hypothetical protein